MEYTLSELIKDLKAILDEHGNMPVAGYTYSETEKHDGCSNPENWISGGCIDIDAIPDNDGKLYAVIDM